MTCHNSIRQDAGDDEENFKAPWSMPDLKDLKDLNPLKPEGLEPILIGRGRS